jgi:CRP/FNR family nitrogen fixation transcriptional regulator
MDVARRAASSHAEAFAQVTSFRASVAGAELFESSEVAGPVISFHPNEEIFGEGEPAEYVYKVIYGAVRTYTLLRDGRRQICGFYLGGETFGLETGENHIASADAIISASVLAAKRSRLLKYAENDRYIARCLWSMTVRELRRTEDHAGMLIRNARERVAAFLIDMAGRSAGGAIELPMPRQDIADYLGLTIETVCRILNRLSDENVIELDGLRRILVRDHSILVDNSVGSRPSHTD